MKRPILSLLFAFLALSLASAVLADPPDSRPKYVVILRDPSAVRAKGAPPSSAKLDVPDFAAAGGKLLEKHGRYHVVTLPPQAVAQLLRNPAVETIQRVYAGSTLPDPVAAVTSPIRTSSDALHSKPDASWDSGVYLYDGAGNIKAIGISKTYNYDSAGRLVKYAENGTAAETYRYDSFGNLVEKTTGSQTQSIPVDTASNRLQGVQYDLNGNVTVNGVDSNSFDPLNMMLRRDTPEVHEHYIYTADDERIAVWDEGYWHITVRDFGAHPMREWLTWDLQSYYLWTEDHIYRDGQLLAADRDAAQGGTRHFHLDHLGTPRLITNSSGYVLAQHDYYPFGSEQTSPVQEVENYGYDRAEPLRFTGHERDSRAAFGGATGNALDYMHARYYTAGLGRFLSVDPAHGVPATPLTWNRYVYARNAPVRFVDLNGAWSTDIHQRLLKDAFPGLNSFAFNLISYGDWAQDHGFLSQTSFLAYTHGMSPWWLPRRFAVMQSRTSYESTKKHAQEIVKSGDDLTMAYLGFGELTHLIADIASPAHNGWKPWGLFPPVGVFGHSAKEATITPAQAAAIITMFRVVFAEIFGDDALAQAIKQPNVRMRVPKPQFDTPDGGTTVVIRDGIQISQ